MGDLALALLAAGESLRFKGNKLLYPFHGKMMYQHVIEQIERLPPDIFEKKIVVTRYREIMDDLKNRGYLAVENRESALGLSHSIHLALQELSGHDGPVCFAVCDQPYLKSGTIENLVRGFRKSGYGIGCLSCQGELGNPAIFSAAYRQELMSLEGDVGGRKVIRRHLDDLYLCEVEDSKELADVDVRSEKGTLIT